MSMIDLLDADAARREQPALIALLRDVVDAFRPEDRARITLTVDAAGNPRIEFLDEAGKVVSRLPAETK